MRDSLKRKPRTNLRRENDTHQRDGYHQLHAGRGKRVMKLLAFMLITTTLDLNTVPSNATGDLTSGQTTGELNVLGLHHRWL